MKYAATLSEERTPARAVVGWLSAARRPPGALYPGGSPWLP